jgi:hypothetical protein
MTTAGCSFGISVTIFLSFSTSSYLNGHNLQALGINIAKMEKWKNMRGGVRKFSIL